MFGIFLGFTLWWHQTWLENPRTEWGVWSENHLEMLHFPARHVWATPEGQPRLSGSFTMRPASPPSPPTLPGNNDAGIGFILVYTGLIIQVKKHNYWEFNHLDEKQHESWLFRIPLRPQLPRIQQRFGSGHPSLLIRNALEEIGHQLRTCKRLGWFGSLKCQGHSHWKSQNHCCRSENEPHPLLNAW